jgi:hypothetical protein
MGPPIRRQAKSINEIPNCPKYSPCYMLIEKNNNAVPTAS